MSAHTVTEYAIQWSGDDSPRGPAFVTTDPDHPDHRDILNDPVLAKYKPRRVSRQVTVTDWTGDES